MTILADLVAYLEQLPAMAALSADEICVEIASFDVGAALHSEGTVCRERYLSGTCSETRSYKLYVRVSLLTNGERAAFQAACEDFCAAVNDADEEGVLPVLTSAGAQADALVCGAPLQTAADDSGFSTFAFPLQLQYTQYPANLPGKQIFGTDERSILDDTAKTED